MLFVIFDDCPPEHGEKQIHTIHYTKVGANEMLKHMKAEKPYEYQYLVIVKKVEQR